jgi:hypothetical protein
MNETATTPDYESLDNQYVERDQDSLIRIFTKGLLICMVIGLLDWYALSFITVNNQNSWPVFAAMALFSIQTIVLSVVIGLQVHQSPAWWLFFGWSLVLVNLNLMLIQFNVDWSARYLSALVFAFFTAQIGLVIFWGILDSSPFGRRSVIAGFLFVACCHPYWLVSESRNGSSWLTMMTAYLVAVIASSVVLRLSGFRLVARNQKLVGQEGQFSILHLFIWTTVVALLFGGGRMVNWNLLLENGNSTSSLVLRSIMMTLITVSTAWTIMSPTRSLGWKLPILILLLLGVGYVLYFLETSSTGRGYSRLSGFWFWRKPTPIELAQIRNLWLSWTLLNGIFFSGLILVIRVAGKRLSRQ